ncbi:MAG: hypothetical protein M3450_15225 [Actinomycetota bacterium]|nr:hypothetical protein [Actinomycetota bacterium]MDQ3692163.1 hypothetical protein [Chloroflexota bacterium]
MIPSSEILSAIVNTAPRPWRLLAHAGHDDAASRQRTPHPAQRVYVASPLTTYRTSRYEAKLAQVIEQFPDATLLPARDLFRSTADWRTRWPALLPTLTELVFFAETDGTIGLGVWSELHDAADCIPVWYLDDAGCWFPVAAVTITVTGDSLARFASVQLMDRANDDASCPSVTPADSA